MKNCEPVSLYDYGCTLGEHWDLIDIILRANSGDCDSSERMIEYSGLDISPVLLAGASILHSFVSRDKFRLYCAEGSDFDNFPKQYDCSFTVGVVNHVYTPKEALLHLIRNTDILFAGVIWITTQERGFWSMLHSGRSIYFFSLADFLEIAEDSNELFAMQYTPESASTQQSSYVGISAEVEKTLGSIMLASSREPSLLPQGAMSLSELGEGRFFQNRLEFLMPAHV